MQYAHLWTVQGGSQWLYIHVGDNVQEDVVQWFRQQPTKCFADV